MVDDFYVVRLRVDLEVKTLVYQSLYGEVVIFRKLSLIIAIIIVILITNGFEQKPP